MRKTTMKFIVLTMAVVIGTILCGSAFAANKGAIKIATNAEFEPFEFIKDGKYAGFDVDLMNAISKKIGRDIVWNNMEFDGVVGSVVSGTCDLAAAALTITPARAKTVAFSVPYMEAAQFIIVRKDDTVMTGQSKKELRTQMKGKKIGVVTGYIGQKYVTGDKSLGFEKIEGAKPVIYDSVIFAVEALKNKAIDLIVMDDIVSMHIADTDSNKDKIKTIEIPLTVEKYALAMNKKNLELKTKIDGALTELIADGTVTNLLKKWEIRD